jgi:hypothetical protein
MGRYKNTNLAENIRQTKPSLPSFRFAKRGNARTQDEVCFGETKPAQKPCLFLVCFRSEVSTVPLMYCTYELSRSHTLTPHGSSGLYVSHHQVENVALSPISPLSIAIAMPLALYSPLA